MTTLHQLVQRSKRKLPFATYVGTRGEGELIIPEKGMSYFKFPGGKRTTDPEKIPVGVYRYDVMYTVTDEYENVVKEVPMTSHFIHRRSGRILL